MFTVAVLIPCYNEAKTIEKVVKDCKAALPGADIYVYDNNSIDGSDKIALNSGAIVRYEYRQGKGNVIRSMFRQIEADCYLMVDGDDTYPIEPARKMVNLVLEEKADMVIGDRLSSTYFKENSRLFHSMGNVLVRRLTNSLFSCKLGDIMTGYRALSRHFVKTFPVLSKGFEIETEMSIHAVTRNFMIREIPVAYRERPAGSQSKLETIPDGLRILRKVFTLYKDYRPLAFFGVLAAVFLCISLGTFFPIVMQYLKTGLVPKLPTLIVSAAFGVCSVLVFLVGTILNTMNNKYRELYELVYNIMVEVEKNDR